MQANNDPNWTEDAAFWNEAWADMDKRLDEEPSGRKAAVVWWRQYSWPLLGLLLLLVGATAIPTAIAYWSPTENTEQSTPAPTDTTPSPTIAAKTESPATTDNKTGLEAAISKNQPSINKSAPAGSYYSKETATPVRITPELPRETGTADDQVTVPERTIASQLPSVDLPAKTEEERFAAPVAQEIIFAVPLLPVYQVSPLKYADNQFHQPAEINIQKSRPAAGLYLTGGASQGLQGNGTGFYAGLEYQLPVGKQFSIPVNFRVRKDFQGFKELSASDQPSRFLDVTDVTSAGSPDTIDFVFSDANITSVTTTSLEATIGLAYSPSPRWQIGMGLSFNYLNSARARVSTQFLESANFAMAETAGLAADIALFNNANFLYSRANMDSQNVQAVSVSSLPEFNQWIYYGNLSVSYALTPKLSLAFAGRRLLTQPDRSRKIGMQQGQIEVGVKWRIW